MSLDLAHIAAASWELFERRFPDAAAFLHCAQLRGELAELRHRHQTVPQCFDPVDQARLTNLENWEKTQQQRATARRALRKNGEAHCPRCSAVQPAQARHVIRCNNCDTKFTYHA